MYKPARTVVPFETEEIDIVEGVSVRPVTGIATSTGQLRVTGSDAQLYRNFDYSGECSRIELRLEVSRLARIQDRQIQLWDGTKLVGSNLANPSAGDVHLYEWQGSFTVTPEFGVVIDLAPHATIPSSNTVYIRRVELAFFP